MPEAKAFVNLFGEVTSAMMQSDQNIKAEKYGEDEKDGKKTYSEVVDQYSNVIEELITSLT